MTETITIGEWIKGPFLCTNIEGFILTIKNQWCEIIVKKVEPVEEQVPSRLKEGSIHRLPTRVINEFYIRMNYEQQISLIQTAKMLGDSEWVAQLVEQFYNPFSTTDIERLEKFAGGIPVYSTVLKGMVQLGNSSQYKLYEFYQEAVQKGISSRLESPDEIDNTEALDTAIASIVLVGKNPDGIRFVQSLVKK
jgi:hypothetical protein